MRNLKCIVFFLLLALSEAPFALADAIVYTTTSADSGPGAGVTYTMTLTQDLSNPLLYAGTFTVLTNAVSTSTWFGTTFSFGFNVPSTDPANVTNFSGPTSDWKAQDALLQPNRSGFTLSVTDPSKGLKLTDGSTTPLGSLFTFSFDVTLPNATGLKIPTPFQVLYDSYNPNSNKWTENRLSADLGGGSQVSEPTSLFLLGSGLIGLAAFVRRRKL